MGAGLAGIPPCLPHSQVLMGAGLVQIGIECLNPVEGKCRTNKSVLWMAEQGTREYRIMREMIIYYQ